MQNKYSLDKLLDTIQTGIIIDAVHIMVSISLTNSKNKDISAKIQQLVDTFLKNSTDHEKQLFKENFNKSIESKVENFKEQIRGIVSEAELKELEAQLYKYIKERLLSQSR